MFNKKLQYKLFCKLKPGGISPLNFILGSDIKGGIHWEEKDSLIEIETIFNKIIE